MPQKNAYNIIRRKSPKSEIDMLIITKHWIIPMVSYAYRQELKGKMQK